MGISLVPETDIVYLKSSTAVDDWGLPLAGENSKPFKCRIKESYTSTGIEDKGGKVIVPTYSISFNSSIELVVGDVIEVYGAQYTILTKTISKDLSGNVLISKVTV